MQLNTAERQRATTINENKPHLNSGFNNKCKQSFPFTKNTN